MCRWGLLALVLTGCSYQAPSPSLDPDVNPTIDSPPPLIDAPPSIDAPPGAPWLAGFTYRKQIVISRTGTTVLDDFPVGIVISGDAAIAAHARTDGRDFVVTTDDAVTRLDSELAGYTAGTGSLEIWTRVPSLGTGATTLWLYYGGPASTTNASSVWSSTFKGVWHLSDVSTSLAIDSTSAAHHVGQTTPAAEPGVAAGVAGLGRINDGVDDMLEIADPIDGGLDVGTQSFSYSIWVRATANLGSFDQPFFKGGTSSSNPGYCIMLGTGTWAAKLHDGTNFIDVTFSATPLLNQWLHLVTVVDRSANTAAAYVNGARVTLIGMNLGGFNTANDFRIGRGSGGARYQGFTDEARIYNSALTADWIATEHENLAASGFTAVGIEQTQ